MENYPSYQGQSNVIFKVEYDVLGTDGTNTVTTHRFQSISFDSSWTFIPYNNLNNDIVISWVQSQMGKNGVSLVQEMLDYMLTQIGTPEPQNSPLPWSNN
jgi:hypothetical protein